VESVDGRGFGVEAWMTDAVERPVFIIGSARSGTNIFYRLLAGHENLGWISSYVRRLPDWPWLAVLNSLYQTPFLAKRYHDERRFPNPVEAYSVWDRFHPVKDTLGAPPLTERDVAVADVEGMRRFIAGILRFSRRARFLNKNVRNSRRIRYLQAIFPDAFFIHIIRDGRAVANSLLHIEWWPTLSLWWAEQKTPTELEREGLDPVVIAARLWQSDVQQVLGDKEYIPRRQYIEVRYEKLVHDLGAEMKRVLDSCDLPWTPHFQAYLQAFDLEDRNYKWKDHFTAHQVASIEEAVGSLLERLQYL
jgi:hypothetical protein